MAAGAQVVPNGVVPKTPGGGGIIPTSAAAPVGANPSLIPGSGVTDNPYAVAGATPSAPGVTVPGAGVPQQNGINWANQDYSVTGDFTQTYGQGTGAAITDVLQNLGTSTDQAVKATIANTNIAADKQYGNIQAAEAAGGVTPNSSTAALAAGDFYSGVNSQLQSTISGMESKEEDTLLDTLMTEGKAHGGDESTFDSVLDGISDALSLGGTAATGASAVTSAINPGADTTWLDAIGALG